MKKNEQTVDEPSWVKLGVVLFVVVLIIFLSARKSLFGDSEDSSLFPILGWIIISIISIVVYVFIIRWTLKINDIVSNQEKTNQLLESINKSLSNKKEKSLPEGDVNDPDYMKKIIDNLK